jgi:hypothetical protein
MAESVTMCVGLGFSEKDQQISRPLGVVPFEEHAARQATGTSQAFGHIDMGDVKHVARWKFVRKAGIEFVDQVCRSPDSDTAQSRPRRHQPHFTLGFFSHVRNMIMIQHWAAQSP